MNFTNEFLTGLYVQLEQYCKDNRFDIKDWLEYQELACQGGYGVFVRYCNENGYGYIVEVAEKLNWEQFDDFIFDLSKQLVRRMDSMRTSEPLVNLIETKEIKEYIELTSDDDYYTEIDTKCVNKVLELEKKAKLLDYIIKDMGLLPYQVEILNTILDMDKDREFIILPRLNGRDMIKKAYCEIIKRLNEEE